MEQHISTETLQRNRYQAALNHFSAGRTAIALKACKAALEEFPGDANLMVLAAVIHMFSVFLTKAYRKPRELTWVSGVLLLFLSLAFGFSGYLLPWNELAFFATKGHDPWPIKDFLTATIGLPTFILAIWSITAGIYYGGGSDTGVDPGASRNSGLLRQDVPRKDGL